MRRILLAKFLFLHSVAHAGEPAKTSARVLEFIQGKELDAAESREISQVRKWADAELVPALRNATSLEVFSLDPTKHYNWVPAAEPLLPAAPAHPPKGVALFHGWRVLGQVVVPKENFDVLRDALIMGIAPGAAVLCYEPRHGIRIKGKKGAVDLEICFQCGQAFFYGRKSNLKWGVQPQVTKDLLNQILDDAKIERDQPQPKR